MNYQIIMKIDFIKNYNFFIINNEKLCKVLYIIIKINKKK